MICVSGVHKKSYFIFFFFDMNNSSKLRSTHHCYFFHQGSNIFFQFYYPSRWNFLFIYFPLRYHIFFIFYFWVWRSDTEKSHLLSRPVFTAVYLSQLFFLHIKYLNPPVSFYFFIFAVMILSIKLLSVQGNASS